MSRLPSYDRHQSYEWNYRNPPDLSVLEQQPLLDECVMPGRWSFCGLPALSPIGISAGPLLNGRWLLYYAALGFDVLTYKTVRSQSRGCYPLPNLVPIADSALAMLATSHAFELHDERLQMSRHMAGSWAISFGMPSQPAQHWRDDLMWTKDRLASGKLLCVSVVASPQEAWTLDDLAKDYARCARWAVDCGADAIELNFSCPNVASCDGQLYQRAEDAAEVAAAVRHAIGRVPLLVKVGYWTDEAAIRPFLESISDSVDALSMVNCVAARVQEPEQGQDLFEGQPRGIGGKAIRDRSLAQVELFCRHVAEMRLPLKIIGVGGISTAADVQSHLNAGAEAVQVATSAMLDPLLALRLKQELVSVSYFGSGPVVYNTNRL